MNPYKPTVELDIRGNPVPDHVQKIIGRSASLRARAMTRIQIAAQDLEHGDFTAYHRNTEEAGRLLQEAHDREQEN